MSGNNPLVRIFYTLCVLPLSVLLFGCDDAPYEGPASSQGPGEPFPEAQIIASVQEGFNPLDVTFNVTGVSGQLTDVTWNFGDGQVATTRGNSSVSHTFTAPGPTTVLATINDPLSSEPPRIFEIDINVLPDVNFIVSSFAIDSQVVPGAPNTVSAIIQNVGTDTFEAGGYLSVGYYLSTDENITVDDILIGDTEILFNDFFAASDVPFGMEKLSPGQNYQYNHQLDVKVNVPAGEYFAGAIVDYIDEFDWYDFPRATDTEEYTFPTFLANPTRVRVKETDEQDNSKLLTAQKVTVSGVPSCTEDLFENDDSAATATPISAGAPQSRNFCFDNSDWLRFDAAEGSIYKIETAVIGSETDTQLILYDQDGISFLLFHDNIGNVEDETRTVDLDEGFPEDPRSEIVWEAPATGTYFIKVRTTACDEDLDAHCSRSPDGVGLATEYSISLQ